MIQGRHTADTVWSPGKWGPKTHLQLLLIAIGATKENETHIFEIVTLKWEKPLAMVSYFSVFIWKQQHLGVKNTLNIWWQNKRGFVSGYCNTGFVIYYLPKSCSSGTQNEDFWKTGGLEVSLKPTDQSAWHQHDKTVRRIGPVEDSHRPWDLLLLWSQPEWRMFPLHISVLDSRCQRCVREVTKAIFFRYIEPGTCLLQDASPSFMWWRKRREVSVTFHMWCGTDAFTREESQYGLSLC